MMESRQLESDFVPPEVKNLKNSDDKELTNLGAKEFKKRPGFWLNKKGENQYLNGRRLSDSTPAPEKDDFPDRNLSDNNPTPEKEPKNQEKSQKLVQNSKKKATIQNKSSRKSISKLYQSKFAPAYITSGKIAFKELESVGGSDSKKKAGFWIKTKKKALENIRLLVDSNYRQNIPFSKINNFKMSRRLKTIYSSKKNALDILKI